MKKMILIVLMLFLFLITAIYFFIPSNLIIKSQQVAGCTSNELNSCLHNVNKWDKWLPKGSMANSINGDCFTYKKGIYKLEKRLNNGALFSIRYKGLDLNAPLQIIPINIDSITVLWRAEIQSSLNPEIRIEDYFKTSDLQRDLNELLSHLKAYSTHTINVYGFNIIRAGFRDTLLIASKKYFNYRPEIKEIYGLIDNLTDYALRNGAHKTGTPMFHISYEEGHYRLMVALPIYQIITEDSNHFLMRMLDKARFIQTEVKGGPETIQNAHNQIEHFMLEHQLTAPALPFEVLITDRRTEPDTSKWITMLYHPST